MAARASSCAPQPLRLPAASSRGGDGQLLEVCGTDGCKPTLLLLLHSWSSGMQQLWFDADLSPLLSLPPDVNILFATSLSGADDITRHMLGRLAALQHTGTAIDWISALLGLTSPPPASHVIEQQLSLQQRDAAPFLYVPAIFPPFSFATPARSTLALPCHA